MLVKKGKVSILSIESTLLLSNGRLLCRSYTPLVEGT